MLEMVAVGAMATQLELRMPSWAILRAQSVPVQACGQRSTST